MPVMEFCVTCSSFPVSARSSRVSPSADGAGFLTAVPGFRASYPGVWQNRMRGTKRCWAVCWASTAVRGLGSPGCASLPPGVPGSHQGQEAGKRPPDGPYRVTEFCDRLRPGYAFLGSLWSLLFPLRARQLCEPHTHGFLTAGDNTECRG